MGKESGHGGWKSPLKKFVQVTKTQQSSAKIKTKLKFSKTRVERSQAWRDMKQFGKRQDCWTPLVCLRIKFEKGALETGTFVIWRRMNDPVSLAAKDDFVAPLSAFAGT